MMTRQSFDWIKGLDCRQVVEADLGPPHHHSQKNNIYKCPLHNESKGYSLVVWEDGVRCFGACNQGWDAVGWTMKFHGLEYREAVERLNPHEQSIQRTSPPGPLSNSRGGAKGEPPDSLWQSEAREIIEIGKKTLWGDRGRRARDYLFNRGLNEDTIKYHQLGFIAGGYKEWKRIANTQVPCGILIPWIADGHVWALKVRRSAGEPKYSQVGGGRISSSLYLADEIQLGYPALILEGEFDALLAWRWGRVFASALAIPSASHWRIDARWYPTLLGIPLILTRMDDDPAGHKAAAGLQGISKRMVPVSVPSGHKGLTEFILADGPNAFVDWLVGLLMEHER